MAQINSIIGDFAGNFKIIQDYVEKAKTEAVDLLIFPELAVSGYPPQDLIFREEFIIRTKEYLPKVSQIIPDEMLCIIGFVDQIDEKYYNSAALIQDKNIVAIRQKTLLPNYDVFDEKRYFTSASFRPP